MSCLAGVGGRVKPLLRTAEQAQRILVIDGCPFNCARHTLLKAGISQFEHLALQEAGLRKGNCRVTAGNINTGVRAAETLLRKSHATSVDKLVEFLGCHSELTVS